LEFNPASTNINEVFIEAAADQRTGTFESIILSSEGPEEADVFEEQPVIAPPAPSAPAPPAADLALPDADLPVAAQPPADDEISFMAEWSAPTRSVGGPPSIDTAAASEIADALEATVSTASTASAEEAAVAAPAMVLLDPARATAQAPRWLLRGAAGLLVLCLAAQLVHHYHGDLADTALLRAPLTAIYRSLGQPLEPRWDIASYEVRQLGASSEGAAPGDLVVRASISNRAKRVQPLPLLRVVMQDRFGNRVAARDLQPAEYLGRGAPQVSLIAPGQRVDVQVAFQDPGQAATGFEIDACMARRDRTVSCANDPSSR
jgi:hypothetical protein